jgi:4-amino-4-deoxy-L-arabinose transferase-like glycosyltransferase
MFFWLLAVLAIAWAALDPRLRDVEGIPTGAICLPISLAAALATVGAAWRSSWRRAALWFALALVGQAAALQMIDAGTRLHYQHYRPVGWLAAHRPWLLLFVGFQTAAVAAGWRGRWGPAWRWLRRNFRWWQLGGVAAVFALTAATVSEDVRFYAAELAFAAFLQTVNLGNIVLAGWSMPGQALPRLGERLAAWFGELGPARRGPDRFALAAALWVMVAAALLSWFSYERHPHIPDEVVYLLHARYFAEGKLALPPPPVPAAFEIDLMNLEPHRWYSPVPPGWPAVLALGVLAGAPWLVNPLLAGLNMLLAFALLTALYDWRTARLSLLLLACSPWHVFMGMNFMTHTLTLTLALAAALVVVAVLRSGRSRWAVLAGLSAAAAALVRPLEGFTLACLLALWFVGARHNLRLKFSAVVAFAAGGLLLGVPALAYNYLLTGDALKFPIMAYTDKYYGPNSNALGFGPDRGLGWAIDPNPGHSPFDALVNANLNTFSINIELLGWSTGSLWLVALYLLKGRLRRPDWLMLVLCLAIFGVHFFYYFSGGPDFGARYWYLMLVPLVVFTAGGLWRLQELAPAAEGRLLTGLVALCAMALINYFPWRAVDKYHHYEQMRPDVRELAEQLDFGPALVLVRGDRHPDYASAAAYNPLNLRAPTTIYAWDRNPEVRRQVIAAYRDRRVWILEGPTRTGAGYRVVAGPFSAQEALALPEAQ